MVLGKTKNHPQEFIRVSVAEQLSFAAFTQHLDSVTVLAFLPIIIGN